MRPLAYFVGAVLAHAPAAPRTVDGLPLSSVPQPWLQRDADSLDAEFGDGIAFRSKDYSVELRGRFQSRGLGVVPGSGNTTEARSNELLIRRMRLALRGHWRQRVSFYMQLGFAARDLEPDLPVPLRDAWLDWHLHRVASVRIGQMKVPFDRQRLTSSGSLQLVDRSSVTSELNLDRDVGVVVHAEDLFGGGWLGYSLGVFGGEGRNRVGHDVGLLYVARLQAAPFGRFDDLSEADLDRSERPRLATAVAAGRNATTRRTRSTLGDFVEDGALTYDHLTADVLVKWRGGSLLTQALYRRALQPNPDARSAWGIFLQAGYMLTSQWEVAARWGELIPLGPGRPSLERLRELGVGVSWYVLEHDLKVQADAFRYAYLNPMPRLTYEVRLQLQLLL